MSCIIINSIQPRSPTGQDWLRGKGELLRNNCHHWVRSRIAECLKKSGKFDIYEEVHCISSTGSAKRADIIAIDNNQKIGFIIDPTIRFEGAKLQPQEVDLEKKRHYEPCFPYLQEKYRIPVCRWEVIGLLFGARGTISRFCINFFHRFHIDLLEIQDIAINLHKVDNVCLRRLWSFSTGKKGMSLTDAEPLGTSCSNSEKPILLKDLRFLGGGRSVLRKNFKILNVIESEVETAINQFVAYSFALDESTDRNDKAHLVIFIRGVNEHFTVSECLLDVITKYNWRRTFPGTERHHRTEEVEFAMACVYSNRRGSSFIAPMRDAGINISSMTTRRRIKELGFSCRTPTKKLFLKSYMVKKRLSWAKQHQSWTVDDWKKWSWNWSPVFCSRNDETISIHKGMKERLLAQVSEWFPDGYFGFMHDSAPCYKVHRKTSTPTRYAKVSPSFTSVHIALIIPETILTIDTDRTFVITRDGCFVGENYISPIEIHSIGSKASRSTACASPNISIWAALRLLITRFLNLLITACEEPGKLDAALISLAVRKGSCRTVSNKRAPSSNEKIREVPGIGQFSTSP
ncbi:hypothetical protein ANN_24793 [Periplaneta americana]|uniref:Transposase Tc1-like domain-containing protein n=1 Tax=Periplaneta americana TaxID=6978 RepID=A0ABQ8RZT2_PERAM|nr:hypothetical protein ANN_24793 [Periplaneta americana]